MNSFRVEPPIRCPYGCGTDNEIAFVGDYDCGCNCKYYMMGRSDDHIVFCRYEDDHKNKPYSDMMSDILLDQVNASLDLIVKPLLEKLDREWREKQTNNGDFFQIRVFIADNAKIGVKVSMTAENKQRSLVFIKHMQKALLEVFEKVTNQAKQEEDE